MANGGCRTISRFLYPCGRQSFLWAGHYYPALATYPEVERDGPSLLPYLVLLRVGFSLPAELLLPRCALTAPFHPYPVSEAVYFLWHFPYPENRIPAVSRHVALWRPDFPPPSPGATTRPAALHYYSHIRLSEGMAAHKVLAIEICQNHGTFEKFRCIIVLTALLWGPVLLTPHREARNSRSVICELPSRAKWRMVPMVFR
jgi:hypothetical protein